MSGYSALPSATRKHMTRAQVIELAQALTTVRPDVAAAMLGISRPTFVSCVEDGTLDVRILKLGRCLKVPTSDICRVLGIEFSAAQAAASGTPAA